MAICFHSLYVRKSWILNTTQWIPDSFNWILDSGVQSLLGFGFVYLYSGFQSPEFRIPETKFSRIPDFLLWVCDSLLGFVTLVYVL